MIAYTRAKLIGAIAASVILGGTGIVVLSGVMADTPAPVAAAPANPAVAPTTMPAAPDAAQQPVVINLNSPAPTTVAGVPVGSAASTATVGGMAIGKVGGATAHIAGGFTGTGTVIITVPAQGGANGDQGD